jgi:hypothetical protein
MSDDLAAEVARLDLSASTADYSKDDWARHNAVTHAWFGKQNEPPLDGGVEVGDLTAGSPTFGQVVTYSAEEIDLEEAFDRAPAGGEEAIAIATRLQEFDRERTAAQTATRHHASRRQSIGTRRPTCRARSSLRGGRPSSRRTSSHSSASSGDPDLGDEPAPPRAAILSYARLAPADRGAVIA